ncbi:MAG: mercuric reductase [Chloroflexi bacterium]|nr:MAG: mercuric reductase [Chloroflexota bacterium]
MLGKLDGDMTEQAWLENVQPADWENPVANGRYNLVVIGGGPAGLVCAAGAAGLGAKVALIERHRLGGDCLNVGCVPSKSVVRSGRAVAEIRRASSVGVVATGDVSVDFGAVMARMRQVRTTISYHDAASRFRELGVDLFFGNGRFVGPDAVEVANQTIRFRRAVIATGARPAIPPIPGLGEAGFFTNETIFDLTELPLRLVVIGAGAVGVELAQAFARLGSQVTLVDALPRVLGREDEAVSAVLERVLQQDGVTLCLGAQIERVWQDNGERFVQLTENGRQQIIATDAILVAAGRRPNVENLNLEAAGVAWNEHGVQVNDRLQTTNRRIFAAGDVALPYQFTHMADVAARLVLQNALFMGRKKMSAVHVPYVIFTDPEVAHIGLYPHEAAARGIAVDTFTTWLPETDRGRTDGLTEGFVSLYVQRGRDKIVGGTIVAPHAGEMIGELAVAMAAGVGLSKLTTVVHPYPTLAEAIRKTADAWNRTRLTPTVARLFGLWFRLTR